MRGRRPRCSPLDTAELIESHFGKGGHEAPQGLTRENSLRQTQTQKADVQAGSPFPLLLTLLFLAESTPRTPSQRDGEDVAAHTGFPRAALRMV